MYKQQRKYGEQKIPCKCSLCGIGIGVSTLGESLIKHDCEEPYIVEAPVGELTLCDMCYRSYIKVKNRKDYLKKLRLYQYI